MQVDVIKSNVIVIEKEKEETSKKRKVAGYARVSTDRDDQFTSYESQIAYYTNYIKSHPDWEFVEIFTDEGISATSTKKRIGFQKMIKAALKGKIDLIVTKSISRFARNTLDSLLTIRKLKEVGVEVFFEKENIWTLDSKGELLITIMSSIAQEESRSLSMNVTWGARQSMREGKAYVPFKAFLGYDRGPNGEMVINQEQAKLVRRIFALAMQNWSEYSIARLLENEGILFSNGNQRWYTSTVSSILRNEKYKGDALRQKTYTKDYLSKERVKNSGEVPQYYIRNHHEPIIDPAIFDRLQEHLNSRPIIEDKRSKNYIFSKRVICSECGGYYGRCDHYTRNNKEVVLWRCNHKFKEQRCQTPTLSEQFIELNFIEAVNSKIQNKAQIINHLRKILGKHVDSDLFESIDQYLQKLLKRHLLIQTFYKDMWFTLLDKLIVHKKNDLEFIFKGDANA